MAPNDQIFTIIRHYPELPPVTISGHAYFRFSLSMNNRLNTLEKMFKNRTRRLPYSTRNQWSPLPRKPR